MGKSAAGERVADFLCKGLCGDWILCKIFTYKQKQRFLIFKDGILLKSCSWESVYFDEMFLSFILYFSRNHSVITHSRKSVAWNMVDLPLFYSCPLL